MEVQRRPGVEDRWETVSRRRTEELCVIEKRSVDRSVKRALGRFVDEGAASSTDAVALIVNKSVDGMIG